MASSVNFQAFLACGTNALATASVICAPAASRYSSAPSSGGLCGKFFSVRKRPISSSGFTPGPSRRKNFRTILSPKIKVALPSSVLCKDGSGHRRAVQDLPQRRRARGLHFALFVVEPFAAADQFEQRPGERRAWRTPRKARRMARRPAASVPRRRSRGTARPRRRRQTPAAARYSSGSASTYSTWSNASAAAVSSGSGTLKTFLERHQFDGFGLAGKPRLRLQVIGQDRLEFRPRPCRRKFPASFRRRRWPAAPPARRLPLSRPAAAVWVRARTRKNCAGRA